MSKILIVDDSEVTRLEIATILKEAGYHVLEAGQGFDGIAKVKDNPDIKIIFSDYNMPDMNGLTMLEQIRAIPGLPKIAFGVITTEASDNLKKKGKEIGVVVWIVKPIEKKSLLTTTELLFKRMAA